MRIPVLGMDPSMRHWGLASSYLNLETGILDDPVLTLIEPKEETHKQVRKNSKDLEIADRLASQVIDLATKSKVVFVEIPVGSQSARAMASYGICIGILGAIRSMGVSLIEVSPKEVKEVFTGNPFATKQDMINTAINLYPNVDFPMFKGKPAQKSEHLADAIASIHAGVQTKVFQNLMQLFQKV